MTTRRKHELPKHRLARLMVSSVFVTAMVLGNPALAQETPSAQDIAESNSVAPIRALGRDEAPVTIDLYASFLCDECADWWRDELPIIERELIDTGKARLVFHDVPVEPIAVSVRAAMIGVCAEPTRFFDVSRAFMMGLGALRLTDDVPAWFEAGISAAGGDRAAMDACRESEAAYEQIRSQATQAVSLGIEALPSLVINGARVEASTAGSIIERVTAGASAPTVR